MHASDRAASAQAPDPSIRLGRPPGLGGHRRCVGTLVLWFHYGTAVFFEMIASGISACF